MESANGSYMQYNNNNNDDFMNTFLQDVEQYSAIDNHSSTPFDPALFAENGLASYNQQPSQSSQQPSQPVYNQAQRATQSQSPALTQFKQTQNLYNGPQYGQNMYGQQGLQSFDSNLLSRPTPSPGPFDQYQYPQQQINYGHPSFDYRFNSFQPQRQASTPTQAFRPQASQAAQQYINGSSASLQQQGHPLHNQQSVGRTLLVSNTPDVEQSAASLYPYQQTHLMAQRFMDPSALKNDISAQPGQPQQSQIRGLETSPYFTATDNKMSGTTLDPRSLQMSQQFGHQFQSQALKPNTMTQLQALQGGQLHNMYQMQPQSVQTAPSKAAPGTKVRKTGQASGGSSTSEDDLDIEEEPEQKPAAITIGKPTDERGKILWEVVDAVWTPRNKPASPDKIRSAISFIGNAVRNLREKWKAANDSLKQAELPDSKTKEQAASLKATVGTYRETMDTLAARVATFGHPSILSRLGEHQVLLSALYSFLLDRVVAGDFNSTLVASILKLGTKLVLLDEEQLEKVKWRKILERFVSKSTNESKTLAQEILNNARRATARKKAEAAGQGPASPSGSASGQVAGVKRPREGSDTPQQLKKPTVKPASKPLSVQLAEQRRLKEKDKPAATKITKLEKSATNGTGASVAARPKINSAPVVKPSLFAGLMSASKRPGTTLAERASKDPPETARAAVNPIKKDAAVKAEAVSTKNSATAASAPSFLGFLADMEKPKEQPKVKTIIDPSETPEARERRLRKEVRRKLRVSWKPEGQLVQTRIFEHDPEEETGHEDSMMRDVGDTGKEGEMLKKRMQMQDADEDSDDEFEYSSPSEVDFSSMADSSQDNFVKCGGSRSAESNARDMQSQHESGNMMTIFAAGEQPDTPQEPPEVDDDDFSPVVDFGEPVDIKTNVRQREQNVFARRQAYQPAAPAHTPGLDLSSALAGLYPQQQVTQSQHQDWLRALSMATQQQQPQAPTVQQTTPNLDLSQLMALVGQAQQQQQQQQQLQQSNYQPSAAPQPTTSVPSFTPDIASILGQLQQSNAPLSYGSGENPNPYPGNMKEKRDKKDNKPKKGKGGAPIGPDGLPLNYKTKVCQFWLDGMCTKGDSCTYRHDRESDGTS